MLQGHRPFPSRDCWARLLDDEQPRVWQTNDHGLRGGITAVAKLGAEPGQRESLLAPFWNAAGRRSLSARARSPMCFRALSQLATLPALPNCCSIISLLMASSIAERANLPAGCDPRGWPPPLLR